MKYDHILIRYGELGLKGKNMKMFISRLKQNIEEKLRSFSNVSVQSTRSRIFIMLNGEAPEPIIEKCQQVFGIYSMSLAIKVENTQEAIEAGALFALENSDAKTFKVVTKRANKQYPIQSQEMNQLLGAHLLRSTEGITVDVHEPDVEVKVEIRNNATYIMSDVVKGLGGLPVKTAGKSLLLLSGGIDSPVAGYLAMKRGVEIEAVHFHSPPFTSERAKQKVLDLAKKLTVYGHSITVHLVPFTNVQQEISKQIPDRYSMTVMRRIMMQISETICQKESILSLTTGESLGQVASQTMQSMHTINEVTNYPILRPLVAMDKEEIVNISKEIDTYDISIRPYEDCCTVFVPKAPKTNPSRERVNHYESEADLSEAIEQAIAGIEKVTIKENDEEERLSHLL